MAGKKKGKGKKGKKEKKVVDELQLRRDLRQQKRQRELFDFEEGVEMHEEKEQLPRQTDKILIAGIEGGGTHSTLAIIDGNGTVLTELKGPDTNHWILGIEETAARINAMIKRGKETLNISESIPLDCVGLSLSGCEEDKTNRLLSDTLRTNHPNAARDYVITSDTVGSLRTGLEGGGIVLIAGTGSNAFLINADGETYGCGGWGYMMGDEGSAYWIAYRACKYVFDDMDGLAKSPRPISYVWPAMRNYFAVTDLKSMLPIWYTNFNKSNIANFTKEIATGCEKEDPLCLHVFEEAGQQLAKHVIALSRKAHNDLQLARGGLKVVCVGSIFKSWKYLQKGFVHEINNSTTVDELSLLRLQASAALGACYLAAQKIGAYFKKDYDKNTELFYHYKREDYRSKEAA